MLLFLFSPKDGIHQDVRKKMWEKKQTLVRQWIHFFWRKCHHFDFCQGMGFTRIFEKNGEPKSEHWSENAITSFGENTITSTFAKGWDSLGFSKKMVKKTAKIGQKKNSVSYLDYNLLGGTYQDAACAKQPIRYFVPERQFYKTIILDS